MAKLVIVLVFIGIAYWYWTGPYQESSNTPPGDDTKQNAEIMQRCIARANSAQALGELGGVGNVGSTGEDAEEMCADENNLIKLYGKWYHK